FASGRYGMEVNLCVGFVYLPLFALLLGAVFDLPYGHTADLLAVSITAFHVLGRLGCLFTGCCYGYPCSWGLWSIQAESYRFPVVPVEGAFTLAILVFLLIRVGRRGYTPDGRALPWMLAIYGLCRFGSEFLRDNEKLFLGLSNISLHALFMMAVGIGAYTPRRPYLPAKLPKLKYHFCNTVINEIFCVLFCHSFLSPPGVHFSTLHPLYHTLT
ncbi:MAG: prolipoprotein diacylglyceryl transferase, partial [Peptococcaceae bacterium]|nr:prolipoprotein diacylglyceryl transferase [Peptococcaceae bacterium]